MARSGDRDAIRWLSLHVLVTLGLGTLGLWLSYGPLESPSWYWAYGAQQFNHEYRNLGGVAEGIRLVLILAIFYLANLWLFRAESMRLWRSAPTILHFYVRVARRRNRWIAAGCIGALVLLVLYHTQFGPLQLEGVCREHQLGLAHLPPGAHFREYVAPYLAYLLYSLCTYLGVALPMFITIRWAIRRDRKAVRWAREHGGMVLRASGDLQSQVVGIKTYFLDLRHAVKRIGNKYLWMFILLGVYWATELSTSLIITLACWAQEATKWAAVWFGVLLLPSFIVRLLRGYWRNFDQAVASLDNLAAEAVRRGDTAAAEAANQAQSLFENEYTGLQLLFYLAKSGSVAALLVATLSATAYETLVKGQVDVPFLIKSTMPYPVPGVVLNAWELLRRHENVNAGAEEKPPCLLCPTCSHRVAPRDLNWKGRALVEWLP